MQKTRNFTFNCLLTVERLSWNNLWCTCKRGFS